MQRAAVDASMFTNILSWLDCLFYCSIFRGFRRVAGQQVPPDTIAYFQRCFHRDKPEDICKMTGGKTKPTPKYTSKSKVAIHHNQPIQSSPQIAAKANEQSDSQGIVKRPSLGGSAWSLGASPHADLSALLPSFQGNAAASLLAHGTNSAAGLASSLQAGVLERANRIQLLRQSATNDVQQQLPFQQASSADLATRMILAANNSCNNSLGSLQLANLLGSGPSSHGLLSPHTNQVDRSTAELAALLSSQHRSWSQGSSNNYSEAAILASLLAQEPPSAAAVAPPVPSSNSAVATRHLLESLLHGRRASSDPAAAASSLPFGPPSIPSSQFAQQQPGLDNSNTSTERQLLQLYLMEQERQLRRQSQQRND